jgi:hypothetical protein
MEGVATIDHRADFSSCGGLGKNVQHCGRSSKGTETGNFSNAAARQFIAQRQRTFGASAAQR